MPLFVTIVLDGVGIGAQPDAAEYGDVGSHTLLHVCEAAAPHLPNLAALGLGTLADLPGVPPAEAPRARAGRLREVSAGKDSTTGHWELAGALLDVAFPTYPDGFPEDMLAEFCALVGVDGVLANEPASGTAVIEAYGREHEASGKPIVYTSADSVFQVAAHTSVIPLERLYEMCLVARTQVCVGEHAVGRVIARPFTGEPGAYERLSGDRHDYARTPPRLLASILQEHGIRTVSVGKIADLFAGVGFDESHPTRGNAEGVAETLAAMRRAAEGDAPTFVWTNLVDFDQDYGHRNDPDGFARALEAFDAALPSILAALPEGALLALTADHGNDPTTPSTDHSREYVPLLLVSGGTQLEGDADAQPPIGLRPTFADHAASVAEYFGIDWSADGTGQGDSFLRTSSP